MSLIRDFDKPIHADPIQVEFIISSVGKALNSVVIPHVTTQADLLSAIFTILYRMLKTAQDMEDPAEKAHNRKEIGDILTNMLMEFGTPSGTVQ
jgi:hypothetical protein